MPVRMPVAAATHDARQMLTVDGMYSVAETFLGSRLEDLDPEETLAHEDLGPQQTRLKHELRMQTLTFSESGMVGQIPELRFGLILHSAYDEALAGISSEQPGCDWVLFQALVNRVNVHAMRAVPHVGQQITEMNMLSQGGNPSADVQSPIGLNRKDDFRPMPEHKMQVVLIFAERGQGQLQDPQHIHGFPGALERYAQSRLLEHLSGGGRQARQEAEKMAREAIGMAAPAPAPARSRKAAPAVEEIDEEHDPRAQKAQELMGEGLSPQAIATALGAKLAEVKRWLA